MSAMPISKPAVRAALVSAALLFAPALAVGSVSILTRAEWDANAPTLEMQANTPVRLTIHHTATKAQPGKSLTTKLKSLQRFSQASEKLSDGRLKVAWGDIPYHYYIDVSGAVGEGREAKFIGDSNTDYDLNGHLSVVLEGNFEDEPPTPAQIESLVGLLTDLAKRYSISWDAIEGHNHYASTACPGKNLTALLPDIRKDIERALLK
jgi:N-acetyl-anhydromuramyl-L-alanine amidase AmpD